MHILGRPTFISPTENNKEFFLTRGKCLQFGIFIKSDISIIFWGKDMWFFFGFILLYHMTNG